MLTYTIAAAAVGSGAGSAPSLPPILLMDPATAVAAAERAEAERAEAEEAARGD